MRISDWSSDVCSSDLVRVDIDGRKIGGDRSLCGDDRGETRLEIGRRNAEDSFEYRVTRRGASMDGEAPFDFGPQRRLGRGGIGDHIVGENVGASRAQEAE